MIRCRLIFASAIAITIAGGGCVHSGSPLLYPHSPRFERRAPDRSVIRFETSKGNFTLEVIRAWAPLGADRFVNLIKNNYYDGSRFFRVVKDRWAQFGINGNPEIAKAWRDQAIHDDPFVGRSNVKGTIAFAFAVPNGRTTQVFINLQDNSATHDREPFVPFGRVLEGMDVVDSLNSEYGDTAVGGIRAGRQDRTFNEGNAYLMREFPRMDWIVRARVI